MIEYHVRKTPRIRILRQVNPLQNIPPYFIINFNIIIPPMYRPFKKSLAFIKLELYLLAFLKFSCMQYSQPTIILLDFIILISYEGQSHWPRGLRSRSAATCLLGLRVRIPPGRGCLYLEGVVCCQVEAPATGGSFAQRRSWPTTAVEPCKRNILRRTQITSLRILKFYPSHTPHLCTRTKYPNHQDVFKPYPSLKTGITKPRVETESYVTTSCYGSWTAKTVKLNDGLNRVRRHTKSTQAFNTNPGLCSSLRRFAGVVSAYWHCLIHEVNTISRFLVVHKRKVSEPRYKCDRPIITSMKIKTQKKLQFYIYLKPCVFRPEVHNCFF